MVAFHDYLTSLDGGKRSAQKATEIVVDINKYLHFANSEACDMNLLLDDDKLRQYMTKLETSGIGPDGIVSKLNTMTYALRYLSYQHRKDVSQSIVHDIEVVVQQIQRWKSLYMKQKKGRAADRLSEFAAEGSLPQTFLTSVKGRRL